MWIKYRRIIPFCLDGGSHSRTMDLESGLRRGASNGPGTIINNKVVKSREGCSGWHGWSSCERWPLFTTVARVCLMCCSLPCHEGFFTGFSDFSSLSKNQHVSLSVVCIKYRMLVVVSVSVSRIIITSWIYWVKHLFYFFFTDLFFIYDANILTIFVSHSIRPVSMPGSFSSWCTNSVLIASIGV